MVGSVYVLLRPGIQCLDGFAIAGGVVPSGHEAWREQQGLDLGGGGRPPPCSHSSRARRAQAAAARFDVGGPPTYDRVVKCDLVERLPEPPRLVIFGGSRAQRFEPSVAEELTGLPAFNFAVQNSRPEDAYAMARYLFWREPGVKLRCLWALQATSVSDSPLHPGLLAEPRLNQFLPEYLVRAQRTVSVSTEGRVLGPDIRFTARGSLVRNSYDARLERGIPFESTLLDYLATMVPRAASPSPLRRSRAPGSTSSARCSSSTCTTSSRCW